MCVHTVTVTVNIGLPEKDKFCKSVKSSIESIAFTSSLTNEKPGTKICAWL